MNIEDEPRRYVFQSSGGLVVIANDSIDADRIAIEAFGGHWVEGFPSGLVWHQLHSCDLVRVIHYTPQEEIEEHTAHEWSELKGRCVLDLYWTAVKRPGAAYGFNGYGIWRGTVMVSWAQQESLADRLLEELNSVPYLGASTKL